MSIPPQDRRSLLEDKYGVSTENGLPEPQKASYDEDMARLASGEPLAYVIGWQPFFGMKIWLDSKPLIPRSETEWIAERASKSAPMRVLDLCAGSGAIGCSLLKNLPEAQVSFGELMPEHEATIRKNIAENGLDAARADIRIGDLFAPFALNGQPERFDLIIANPPYIPDDRALDSSVQNFEPREALRGGADGLDFIRRIAADAPKHLNAGGELWLEVDAGHADEARSIVERALGSATLYPDPYGRPRLVVGNYA